MEQRKTKIEFLKSTSARFEISFSGRSALCTLLLLCCFLLPGQMTFAQNKVDLEDLNIKGELINDERMHLTSRDAQQMAEKITYRTNFRKEIIDAHEVKWPSDSLATPQDSSPTMRQPASLTESARP